MQYTRESLAESYFCNRIHIAFGVVNEFIKTHSQKEKNRKI